MLLFCESRTNAARVITAEGLQEDRMKQRRLLQRAEELRREV